MLISINMDYFLIIHFAKKQVLFLSSLIFLNPFALLDLDHSLLKPIYSFYKTQLTF